MCANVSGAVSVALGAGLQVKVLWLETKQKKQDSVELEASLAPAKADVGAEAKADQKLNLG